MEIKECVCCGKAFFFDPVHMLAAAFSGNYVCDDCFKNVVAKAFLIKLLRKDETHNESHEM